MELKQMSPPPSSPMMDTEGDDPCGINAIDVAIDGVTLLVCLCGLVGNVAVLWLLGFRIRRNPITVYILNLAVADFTLLLFMVPISVLYLLDNVSCSPAVPLHYLRPLFLLLLFSYDMGLYLLAAISIERCASVLFPLWYRCHRPQHQSWVVCALLWVLSITVMATVTSLCLSPKHKHEHCQVALIYMYALTLFIFALPMVISNVILFIKVQCGSKRQQPKRLYIVIFLTVLFFLTFGVPLSLCNFRQQLTGTPMSSQVVFLLACINSSINPFIYFLVGSCRRHCSVVSFQIALQRVFEETGITTSSS